MKEAVWSDENFLWHKLHSLAGVVPIGFYMVQHLALNSFSLAGPEKYNAVIAFFQGIPPHILLTLEILVLIVPILFHGVYGLFITSRAELMSGYKPVGLQYQMFVMQRITGVVLFVLIIAHVASTTVNAKVNGEAVIEYGAWRHILTSAYYVPLVLYAIGVLMASYHLAYGIWNFCIRWGLTIRAQAQDAVAKVSAVMFVLLTLLGWAALAGFLMYPVQASTGGSSGASEVPVSSPAREGGLRAVIFRGIAVPPGCHGQTDCILYGNVQLRQIEAVTHCESLLEREFDHIEVELGS
jgi:succinate dehydrogenase / fumarate reductase cytochrome b subunit